jgi:hypothetical protein
VRVKRASDGRNSPGAKWPDQPPLHAGEQVAVDGFLTRKIDWQNGDGRDECEKEADACSAQDWFHLDSHLPIRIPFWHHGDI